MDNLTMARKKMQSIDEKVVDLLNQRCLLSVQVGEAKQQRDGSKDIFVPNQEINVFERVERLNTGPLPSTALRAIYREIMSASMSLQKQVSLAYLGPRGSFTHQAAVQRFGDSLTFIPRDTIDEVFEAVDSGQVIYAVVPLENSIAGVVTYSLDQFTRFPNLEIIAEIYLNVQPCILSNFQCNAIKRVYSMPMAFAQCQTWLRANLPASQVEYINVASTSRAAELASQEQYAAAICSPMCARLYGLGVVAESIQDIRENVTRFLVITKNNKEIGKNIPVDNQRKQKAMILFFVDHRQPGALSEALRTFQAFKLNLTSINSRPRLDKKWHYWFFVECEVSDADRISTLMQELSKHCLEAKLVGIFPDEKII